MQQSYGDKVSFIGVAGRDDGGAMTRFVAKYGVGDFPHIADLELDIWQEFGVTSQPAFVFINDDGTAEGIVGGLGIDGLTSRVEDLIAS